MDTIAERYIAGSDGIAWRVELVRDPGVTPDEYNCYSPEDIAAWRAGEWQYVGVIVTSVPSLVDGAGEVNASVWAVEYGSLRDVEVTVDNIIEEFFDDLRDEALSYAAK
jgi:hypothetical protein